MKDHIGNKKCWCHPNRSLCAHLQMLPCYWQLVKCTQIMHNDGFYIVIFNGFITKIKKELFIVIQLHAITHTDQVKKSHYVLTMHLQNWIHQNEQNVFSFCECKCQFDNVFELRFTNPYI